MDWFKDRIAVLATMHSKEQVIAPLLEGILSIEVPSNFNTDQFGTFTRDIDRAGTQIEAARRKIEAALQLTGHSLGIASEGSFGAHPMLFGLPYNQEIVLLIDQANSLEIIGRANSTETNFRHQVVQNFDQAQIFANSVGFPEHGLIAMPVEREFANAEHIIKGITSVDQLESAVHELVNQFGSTHLETDMRAMYNPTRMKVIAQATQNLVEKLFSQCPNCQCPGFDVTQVKRGLPCALCKTPTALIRSEIYRCQACQFEQEKLFPTGHPTADPGQCEYCNP
jgi:hypothetical protein